jgi:rhodanese-related sulfurtransferase
MRFPTRPTCALAALTMCALFASALVLAGDAAVTHAAGRCPEPSELCLRSGAGDPEAGLPDLRVSLVELDRLLQVGDVMVVDVREEGAYLAAHLPGAISVPLDDLEGCIARLRAAGRRVVTYCDSAACVRSARAASILRRLGVPEVQALDGGFPAWVDSGRVVVVQPT